MGQSDVVAAGGFSALVIALLTSLAGNIRYTWPAPSLCGCTDGCGSCAGDVADLRADIRVTLYLEFAISIAFAALVGFGLWCGRPRDDLDAGAADKPDGCSEPSGLPAQTSVVGGEPTKAVDFQLSQAVLNEHKRGPRR
jgi:hypothetical protein